MHIPAGWHEYGIHKINSWYTTLVSSPFQTGTEYIPIGNITQHNWSPLLSSVSYSHCFHQRQDGLYFRWRAHSATQLGWELTLRVWSNSVCCDPLKSLSPPHLRILEIIAFETKFPSELPFLVNSWTAFLVYIHKVLKKWRFQDCLLKFSLKWGAYTKNSRTF